MVYFSRSGINDGVYKCGFAKTQEAYDKAIELLTSSMDRLEEHLTNRTFLVGERFTLSDIRLFVTLIRYDEVRKLIVYMSLSFFFTNKIFLVDKRFTLSDKRLFVTLIRYDEVRKINSLHVLSLFSHKKKISCGLTLYVK